jgi:ribonuclease G
MSKELVISASSHERRVAILEEGQLVEIYIEREKEFALVGSIYKGKVTRVLPGMQSAFVDIGLDGDAFLYVSDVFENLEDYDHGHSHGDASAAVIASGGALIEPLPGETLSTRTIHEETLRLDEPGEEQGHDHGPSEQFHGAAERHEGNTDVEAQPAEINDLDERQPESNASAPQNFAPSYNPTRNYPPRIGNDRPQGNDRGGDRGGDRDRGRGGRRGRFGRRRGGGGDRDRDRRPHGQGGGRNLPPSKYASPQGDRDNRGGFDNRRSPIDRGPIAPIEKHEDDIILPGESLAKHRARPVPAPVEPLGDPEPEERQPDYEQTPSRPAVGLQSGTGTPRRFSGSLPHWVLADTEAEAEASGSEAATGEHATEAAAEVEHAEETSAEPGRNAAPALSDEEAVSLSARLVEAKHEETQARAEADSLVGGADFDEDEAEALHEAHEIAEREEHRPHEEETEEEQDEREEREDREDAEGEARETQFAAESSHVEHHEESGEEQHAGESHAELTEAERADLAHDEAIEHVEAEALSAAATADGGTVEAAIEDDTILLPGETRSPRNPNAPREDFARIGTNPRSRFQRPQRGGRDRGGDRGGFRGRGGRPDGRSDRPHRGRDRGPDRGPDRGGDRGRGRFERRGGHGPHRGHHGGHAPSRRPQLISEMLKAGQDIVVQIAKEPLGKKGARITSHVALPGRFLVYMPTIDHIGVSRKIASAENRSRLRRLVGEARGS